MNKLWMPNHGLKSLKQVLLLQMLRVLIINNKTRQTFKAQLKMLNETDVAKYQADFS